MYTLIVGIPISNFAKTHARIYYCIIYYYDVDKIVFPKKLVSVGCRWMVGYLYIFSRSAPTI